MGLFKQKMNFDQFSYFAIQQVYLAYEPEKEAIIDKAQWENKGRLTQVERDNLWNDFTYFIPIGIGVYAVSHFKGKYPVSDVFARVTEAYIHFLNKDRGLDHRQIEIFMENIIDYSEKFEQVVSQNESLGDGSMTDPIAAAGVAFTQIHAKDDRTYQQIVNQETTKESDKMFSALKFAKTYLIKGGILNRLYGSFKITW